ncbi:centrosomal protein of 128 kDa-like, partial [Sipha flava]|uniref:Centrosomal protein of 128 kDa-like n=1 Tax=Sipha flava TaxID=143950 RepID=A0A8B8FJI1_9HEMI
METSNKNLLINSDVKPIVKDTIQQKQEGKVNTTITHEITNDKQYNKKIDREYLDKKIKENINKSTATQVISTSSNEIYERTKTNAINSKKITYSLQKDIHINEKTNVSKSIDDSENIQNLQKEEENKSYIIKLDTENEDINKYTLVKRNVKHESERSEIKNKGNELKRNKENDNLENNKIKQYIEGVETDKIHFDEFYKWVEQIVEEKNEQFSKEKDKMKNKHTELNKLKTASVDKENIEDESSHINEYISDVNTKQNLQKDENIKITKPFTLKTYTVIKDITKTEEEGKVTMDDKLKTIELEEKDIKLEKTTETLNVTESDKKDSLTDQIITTKTTTIGTFDETITESQEEKIKETIKDSKQFIVDIPKSKIDSEKTIQDVTVLSDKKVDDKLISPSTEKHLSEKPKSESTEIPSSEDESETINIKEKSDKIYDKITSDKSDIKSEIKDKTTDNLPTTKSPDDIKH